MNKALDNNNRNNEKELIYQIALTKIPNIGSVLAKQLLSYCGSLEKVFQSSKRELIRIPKIGEKLSNDILNANALRKAESEIKLIEKNKIRAHYFLDKNYPSRLKHFDDCPIVLYSKGNIDWNKQRMITVIGTRQPSFYGKEICEELIRDLKPYDATILSGLAHGIDSLAHQSALKYDLATYGILGHGLKQIYPAKNKKLANAMCEKGGLITEFGFYTAPDRENFPKRNRIVAGMSDAIVVIESKAKGGSLITVSYANEYSKDVFAFPGRVKDQYSIGCNKLIKEHKASLIESVADLAYIMQWDIIQKKKQLDLFQDLNEQENKLVKFIEDKNKYSIDSISRGLSLSPTETASTLLSLEFKGLVRSLPGKNFILR